MEELEGADSVTWLMLDGYTLLEHLFLGIQTTQIRSDFCNRGPKGSITYTLGSLEYHDGHPVGSLRLLIRNSGGKACSKTPGKR